MINKEREITMDRICRSCMSESENMKNVFESRDIKGGQDIVLAEMLMACASVEVVTGDGLPVYLCSTCEEKLDVAFVFKQQCERTDLTLRKLKDKLASKENIKEESMDIVVQPDMDMYDNNYLDESSEEDDNKPELKLTEEEGVFKCIYCQKELRTKKGLKIHERRHTGEKLRYCTICKAKFTRTNHLVRHLRTHYKHGEELKCVDCNMQFDKISDLVNHCQEHNGETEIVKIEIEPSIDFEEDGLTEHTNKTEKRFECNFCGKIVTTHMGLQIHMRKHTGKNLATCELCDKSFTKRSHLKRHMQTHGIIDHSFVKRMAKSGDKEKRIFECEFCDRKFKYKRSFAHHVQTEHDLSDDSDVPLSVYIAKRGPKENEENQLVEQVESSEEKPKEANEISTDEHIQVSSNGSPKTDSSAQNEIHIANISDKLSENDDFDNDMPDGISEIKKERVHICHVCGASFARSNHLTRHMIVHQSMLIHKCSKCDKAFATEEHLEKHTQEDHVEKPYVCTVCNKQFTRGEHLIRHLKVHDEKNKGPENLKCSICEKEFTRSDMLARHTKIHLQQDKRHVCSICGKAFNRLDNLRTHQKIHTGIKDNTKLHLCVYCGKEFNNSSNMIVHMRRHTGERPYKCNECGKGFPRSHDLKCHERTHSGEKPYLCTLCGKSFNKSNKLLRHTRVHTGERPYVCNLCGRAFTQSNDLALHMRRHTGARPYACGMCPARFIQSGQLKAHRRSTGHWMETPPELKGGHRVEPVTPVVNPPPIKFKSHGKPKKEVNENFGEPRILNRTVGILGNISIRGQPSTLLENSRNLQFHGNAEFQSVGGNSGLSENSCMDEVKEEGTPKEVMESNTFQSKESFSSRSESSVTFSQSESFSYHSYT